MGMIYDVTTDAVAVTTAQDLLEHLAPSDATVLVHALKINQSSDTDSEQIEATISRVTGAPSSGSGGSTATPRPRVPGASAAGSTVETNNTTQISGGTSVFVGEQPSFNILNGEHLFFDPPIEISPSTRLVVALPNAPDDELTITTSLVFEEVGG